jgi:hypothetical protein
VDKIPRPGAGIDLPALSVAVLVYATIPSAIDVSRRLYNRGSQLTDSSSHLDGSLGRHENLNTASLRLHETSTSGCRGSRHFVGLTSACELGLCVRSSLHVGEFVRSFFREVIESSCKHDLGLARQDGIASNFDRLQSCGARSDWNLDRTVRGDEQKIDPALYRPVSYCEYTSVIGHLLQQC